MKTYVVIGLNGEKYKIQAESFDRNHERGRVRFFIGMTAIASFELRNIVGFYEQDENNV